MAQISKGRLVKGPYKPICRDCIRLLSRNLTFQLFPRFFLGKNPKLASPGGCPPKRCGRLSQTIIDWIPIEKGQDDTCKLFPHLCIRGFT